MAPFFRDIKNSKWSFCSLVLKIKCSATTTLGLKPTFEMTVGIFKENQDAVEHIGHKTIKLSIIGEILKVEMARE